MRRPQLTIGDHPARSRWAAVREPVLDATGAALLWTAMAVDLATRPLTAGQSASTAAAYLWAGLLAGPFAVHRRFPVLAMVVSNVALIAYALGHYSAYPGYATFALVFAVALHVGHRRALMVYLGGVAGLIVALLLQPAGVATASSWIGTILTATVAWLAGENLRARRARRRHELDEARRQAQQQGEEARRLVQQQAEEARRAISAERLRIARDLHDVVAHSMSVIAVQAGAVHHVIDERPEAARAALGSIEVTAREGLVELRRMLGVLRAEDDATEHARTTPTEGLRDVDRLLSQFRSAGLRLEVSDIDHTGDLPPALDISAYRIIQEGLTNVLRHGGPVAHLDVRRSPTELRIEIRDDGRPRDSAPATPGSGHGLTGIRERAALFNGTVEAEPIPGGGFRLTVELPIAPPVAAR
ncbi:MAG TPA: sensor histidine kinase [Propionibacteriaceae bacterium]|jgi:signal transduction histidine kinase|nr:sensor histidine kinase [Propionibacteriaceae bacterium]